MQTLPNLLASRTQSHLATGSGGCQRSAPTGGAANGMPLNARTPGEDSMLLPRRPESSVTGSLSFVGGALAAAACSRGASPQETSNELAAIAAKAPVRAPAARRPL